MCRWTNGLIADWTYIGCTNIGCANIGAPIKCDDFQIAVLTAWVEYKKHKNLMIASSKMQFNIRLSLLKN